MNELMEILKVLLKYDHENSIAAEHDVIYLTGPEPDKLTVVDRATLEKLNCFYDASYQSWTMFT